MTVFGPLRVDLPVDEIPKFWYNILPDMPEPCPPPLDPRTLKPAGPELLLALFPKSLVMQEVSPERFIQIPDEVREIYIRMGRPTPLYRAKRLEEFLKTPAEIYF
ncbi:MAG: hypothetical protein LUQ46_01235, partial [Candidatus Methanomethyliaceae archaeon]|nr:hypothetical protein [Candidatus Methanomethyliaceae archaeon]